MGVEVDEKVRSGFPDHLREPSYRRPPVCEGVPPFRMDMERVEQVMPADEVLGGIARFLAHEGQVEPGSGVVLAQGRPGSGAAQEITDPGAVSFK